MAFTTATLFPFDMTPMANISAPTYRDGITYTRTLEQIKVWLNTVLVPEFNDGIANAIAEFQNGIANAEKTVTDTNTDWTTKHTAFTTAIDQAVATFKTDVNASLVASEVANDARMDTAEADIAASKAAWQESWDAFIANVEMELAALSDSAAAGLVRNPSSALSLALQERAARNILDYGVTRGTAASQTAAIKAALDAHPGEAFYFPPGDYRLDTELVINQANSLELADGARLYAGAAMTTLVTYLWTGAGYAEDKGITGQGWVLDGALLANRVLSLGKVIRFSLRGGNIRDGINRGLVTEAGLGAELIAEDLRFYNTTATNVTDNIAIEANMGDCHYRDIIIRDWTTAIKDTSGNRWNRIHPWISQDTQANPQMTNRYPTSIGFDLTGSSDMVDSVTDTYRTAYKFRTNGTAYTARPRLINCRAMWAADPILTTAQSTANPATVFDNADGVGVLSDRFTMNGSPTNVVTYWAGPYGSNMDIARTASGGYVKGAQGTTNDSFNYHRGIQQVATPTLFTPTLYGTGSAGVHAYTRQSGRMVTDGETVTWFIRVTATLDATTAFAGALRIGPLPLPQGAESVRDAVGAVGLSTNANLSAGVVYGSAAPFIDMLYQTGTGTAAADIPALALRGKAVDIMVTVTATLVKN